MSRKILSFAGSTGAAKRPALLSATLRNVYHWQSETSKQRHSNIAIPETLDISKVQHLVTKVGQHEREDGILHEVIE